MARITITTIRDLPDDKIDEWIEEVEKIDVRVRGVRSVDSVFNFDDLRSKRECVREDLINYGKVTGKVVTITKILLGDISKIAKQINDLEID